MRISRSLCTICPPPNHNGPRPRSRRWSRFLTLFEMPPASRLSFLGSSLLPFQMRDLSGENDLSLDFINESPTRTTFQLVHICVFGSQIVETQNCLLPVPVSIAPSPAVDSAEAHHACLTSRRDGWRIDGTKRLPIMFRWGQEARFGPCRATSVDTDSCPLPLSLRSVE